MTTRPRKHGIIRPPNPRIVGRVRDLSQAVDRWLEDARDRNLTAHTRANYDKVLTRFAAYLKESAIPAAISAISAENVRAFSHELQEHGRVKPSSVRTYLVTLATFFAFCRREGWIDRSPFDDRRLRLPKVAKRIIPAYTPEELRRFRDACDSSENHRVRLRDLAVFHVLLDTGIRESELCGILLADLHFTPRGEAAGYFKVFGKGQKERYAHFSTTTAGYLRDYLEKARPDSDDPHLFLAKGGGPFSTDGLYELVKRKGEQAGIPGATVHRFRHTFAMTFLEKADVAKLQRALGHERPEQSLWYAAQLPTAGAKEHRIASPVEQLGLPKRRR